MSRPALKQDGSDRHDFKMVRGATSVWVDVDGVRVWIQRTEHQVVVSLWPKGANVADFAPDDTAICKRVRPRIKKGRRK